MALIQCPECHKPNVSSSAVSCPECGYVFRPHKASKKGNPYLPLVFGIALIVALVWFYHDIWSFRETLIAVLAGAVLGVVVFKARLHPVLYNGILLVIGVVGTARLMFEFNIDRLDLCGFFECYTYSFSYVIGVAQIASAIIVLLFVTHWLFDQPHRQVVSTALYIAGLLWFAVHLFEIVYLTNEWGTGVLEMVYIAVSVCNLLWYSLLASVTQNR